MHELEFTDNEIHIILNTLDFYSRIWIDQYDLIMKIDLESLPEVNRKECVTVITQPDMRYVQGNATVQPSCQPRD